MSFKFEGVGYDDNDYEPEDEVSDRDNEVMDDGPDEKWFTFAPKIDEAYVNTKIMKDFDTAVDKFKNMTNNGTDGIRLQHAASDVEKFGARALKRNYDISDRIELLKFDFMARFHGSADNSGTDNSDEDKDNSEADDSFSTQNAAIYDMLKALAKRRPGAKAAADGKNPSDSGETDDEDVAAAAPVEVVPADPLKELARALTTAVSQGAKSDQEKMLKKVLKKAKEDKQAHIVAYTLGALSQAVMDSAQREKCIVPSTWTRALGYFEECLATIAANGLRIERERVYEEAEESAEGGKSEIKAVERFALNFRKPMRCSVPGSLRAILLGLFDEVHRTCQNQDKNYVACLEMEARIVDVAYGLMDSPTYRDVAPRILAVFSTRTPRTHALLAERFGTKSPLDVEGLWDRCRASKSADCFLHYCFHIALNGKHADAHTLLLREFSNPKMGLFSTDNRAKTVADDESTPTKVLYNRVLIQIGMGYFYAGQPRDAAELLGMFCETSRWQTLVGQLQPSLKSSDDSLRARTKMLYTSISAAPHQHIPLDRVECIYLLSKAFECAAGFAKQPDGLATLLKTTNNDVAGSPVTPKEFIAACYHALSDGDAPTAIECIAALPLWDAAPTGVVEQYTKLAKTTALRCFIYSGGRLQCITVDYLRKKFQLSDAEVRKTVHSILLNPESSTLTAFWEDDSEASIVIEQCIATPMDKAQQEAVKNITS